MANPRQLRNLTFGLGFGAVTAALAIAFMLAVVASQPAQAQTYTVLHNFSGGEDGASPYAGVTLDGGGNVYGTAADGGIGYGTVYKLTHGSWVLDTLYSFPQGIDGAFPEARVIFGPNHILYGTTTFGGAAGAGTAFSLRPFPTPCRTTICPWMATLLFSFIGSSPAYGDLTFDQEDNIYGAQSGNAVFELTPPGTWNTETILYSFSGSDGAGPEDGVIFDNAGTNLYGTTVEGGLAGYGEVFELTKVGNSWIETTVNNFRNGDDGGFLVAGVIFDPSGNLYGATTNAGTGGGGTVFELIPSDGSWTLHTLYSFTGGGHCGPQRTLFMDGAGNLYGTTFCDGAYGFGNVWELTPSSGGNWTYTSLYDFTGGSDGANPLSNVTMDSSGNLYGTASAGGTQNVGVVWEITP